MKRFHMLRSDRHYNAYSVFGSGDPTEYGDVRYSDYEFAVDPVILESGNEPTRTSQQVSMFESGTGSNPPTEYQARHCYYAIVQSHNCSQTVER